MKRIKTYRVLLLKPDGFWYGVSVPVFFDVGEVQRKNRHSAVVLVVPAGYEVYARAGGIVFGPCHAIWNSKEEGFVITVRDVTKLSHREVDEYAFGD